MEERGGGEELSKLKYKRRKEGESRGKWEINFGQ